MEQKLLEIEKEVCNVLTASTQIEIVPKYLIRQFAFCYLRWIEAEEKNSQLGLIAKHSSGTAVESPYVKISIQYMKQSNETWEVLQSFVKDETKRISYKKFMERTKYEDRKNKY